MQPNPPPESLADTPTALEIDLEIERLTAFASESWSNIDICVRLERLRERFRQYVGDSKVIMPPFQRVTIPPRPQHPKA